MQTSMISSQAIPVPPGLPVRDPTHTAHGNVRLLMFHRLSRGQEFDDRELTSFQCLVHSGPFALSNDERQSFCNGLAVPLLVVLALEAGNHLEARQVELEVLDADGDVQEEVSSKQDCVKTKVGLSRLHQK